MRWQRNTTAVKSGPAPTGQRFASPVVADLVVRAKHGDGEAFGLLYDRYGGDVYAFVARRLSDRAAAEDATQTIFMRALQSLASCRDDAAFPGWLFAIARNIVTDTYRAGRFHVEPLGMGSDQAFDPEDPALTPEEIVVQRDDASLLRDARERCLAPSERELFDMLLTDMNDKQIADVLGRTHGAIRVAHHRLLAKLRECLGKLIGPGGAHGVRV